MPSNRPETISNNQKIPVSPINIRSAINNINEKNSSNKPLQEHVK